MKEKIYLDTDMIYGCFGEMHKAISGKKKTFEEPDVIKSIREGRGKREYRASAVTKGEIIRRLRTELNFTEEKAADVWKSFIQHINAEQFGHKEADWNFINETALKVKIKKRLSNLIHLPICKDAELTFLTGDNQSSIDHNPALNDTGLVGYSLSYYELKTEKEFVTENDNNYYQK